MELFLSNKQTWEKINKERNSQERALRRERLTPQVEGLFKLQKVRKKLALKEKESRFRHNSSISRFISISLSNPHDYPLSQELQPCITTATTATKCQIRMLFTTQNSSKKFILDYKWRSLSSKSLISRLWSRDTTLTTTVGRPCSPNLSTSIPLKRGIMSTSACPSSSSSVSLWN